MHSRYIRESEGLNWNTIYPLWITCTKKGERGPFVTFQFKLVWTYLGSNLSLIKVDAISLCKILAK